MMLPGIVQIVAYLAAIMLLAWPLGSYMARVFERKKTVLDPILSPLERFLYRSAGIRPDEEMDWKANAGAMLAFNALGFLAVYTLQRLQDILPLNPGGFPAVSPDSAFNTAVSFASNTNWQGYSGENTMSYFTQMAGFTAQNFLSAATGIALCVLVIRGVSRHSTRMLGNFWVDMTRSTLYILLPLSILLALLLVSQGVVQCLTPYIHFSPLQPVGEAASSGGATQLLPMGPAASQIAIKQLGTNGGGFFGANSAHPFENPTPLSNLLRWWQFSSFPPHCASRSVRW